MQIALAILVIGFTVHGAAGSEIARPNLVPEPQRLERIYPAIPLGAGLQIRCPQADRPMLKAAMEQIQTRLTALGSPAAGNGLHLIVGTADHPAVAAAARQLGATVTASDPGPQGYVIRFGSMDGRPTALLAGSDEPGTLYACVTFAQMLRADAGGVLVDAADVRDWPDFHQRIIGRPRLPMMDKLRRAEAADPARREHREFVAAVRQAVDFCVAFKINGMVLRRSMSTGPASHIQSYGPALRAALREGSAYARDRGVRLEAAAYSAIDVGQGGPASQVQCIRTHGVGYCWSRDEMLREQARHFARFAADAGIGLYYLHAPDRTHPEDPASFSQRCEQCKARWKDADRAKADAHVMNILYEEIRKLSPQTQVCAVLVPYGATLDRLDPAKREQFLAYWRECSALLPADMAICVRENRRPNVAAFKEAFAKHPIYFYIESITWRGWEPLFTTTPRHLQTFDFDDPRDFYYLGNSADFLPLTQAMAAQFAWKTASPGAALQRAYNHHPFEDGTRPPEVAGDLVNRIAARFFGQANAALVGDAIRGDISWGFTADPEQMARSTAERFAGKESDIPGQEQFEIAALRDLPGLMRHQHDGASAGRRALRQVFDRIRSGAWKPDPWQREQLSFLLSYYASVEALAAVRYPLLAATAANLRGDRSAATAHVEAGLKAADAAEPILRETADWIGGMDAWHAPAKRVAERIAADRADLQRLGTLLEGRIRELADTPDNLRSAVFLLRDRKVTTRSGGNGDLKFTDELARTPGQKILHFTRPEKPWAGCSVSFDPVDVQPFIANGGALRFYVNSAGPKGWHRATFWGKFKDAAGQDVREVFIFLHKPSAEERNRHDRPGFVEVDDLPDTWQLVTIPLSQFAGQGAAFLCGLHLNFAKIPDHGLLIADPYLIGPTEPVWVERLVQK